MNKELFFKLLFSSVKMVNKGYPGSIFYCYNKSIERQLKYNKLFNINKPINYKLNNNDILFEQNTKTKKLFIDYDRIWGKFNSEFKYKSMSMSIYGEIDSWLKDKSIWKQYTPKIHFFSHAIMLNNDSDWCQYEIQLCRFNTTK